MASSKESTKNETSTQSQENIKQDIFLLLSQVNVNDHVEQKDTGKAKLNYLSWVWAWSEVRKRFPDANYTVKRDPETNLPYKSDPRFGIMVETTVKIGNEEHPMWLPVMDGANNAMKEEPYEIQTKLGTKTVAKASMMDINKAIMRCLAKNLAMFGLGIYIYAGEDMPEENDEAKATVAELVEAVAGEIERLKTRDKIETSEQKKELAVNHIIPFIGNANYKMCKDADKLNKLLEHLKAA